MPPAPGEQSRVAAVDILLGDVRTKVPALAFTTVVLQWQHAELAGLCGCFHSRECQGRAVGASSTPRQDLGVFGDGISATS